MTLGTFWSATGSASAQTPFGAASAYCLYTTSGNVSLNNSDSQGAIASAGNIDGMNYFSTNQYTTGSNALVAAGSITGSFSSYGHAYAQGTITSSITYYNGATGHAGVAAASMPFSFSSTTNTLINQNLVISQQTSVPGVAANNQVTFTATKNGVNYFSVSGSSLYTATSGINFSSGVFTNVSFIVNVTSVYTTVDATANPFGNAIFNGSASTMVDGGQNLAGINKVLYNISPSIAGFSATGFQGSILAPKADFNGISGGSQADGNMIAKSYNQNAAAKTIELHSQYNGTPTFYTGFMPTPATPGEESLFLGLGIGALKFGNDWRRGRRQSAKSGATIPT